LKQCHFLVNQGCHKLSAKKMVNWCQGLSEESFSIAQSVEFYIKFLFE